MRPDGRAHDQLRPVTFTTDYTIYAEGAALIEMGRTRVLCTATVEEAVPPWLKGQGRGWVTAEYAMLPRATGTRIPRGRSARAEEIRRLIGRSLRASVDLAQLGERQIVIDCDVLQADGGTRTASVTGGYVALAMALHRLIGQGAVTEAVFGPSVAAVSVGLVDGVALLDLDYAEDQAADADCNLVINAHGEYVEVQGTAEGRPFARRTLSALLDLAEDGVGRLLEMQQAAIDRWRERQA
ncbi:MAG: ribonuclease PH [Anaerolineae bacterium]